MDEMKMFGPTLPSLGSFVVYRKALEVAAIVYALDVAGDLREQLLRASASVVLNIAEGSGQGTGAGRRRHWAIARGSMREVAAGTDLAAIRLGATSEIRRMAALVVEVDRMLTKLVE